MEGGSEKGCNLHSEPESLGRNSLHLLNKIVEDEDIESMSLEGQESLAMTKVAPLMRAEDADLLESIHNLTSSNVNTPMMTAVSSGDDDIPPLSLGSTDVVVEGAQRRLFREAVEGNLGISTQNSVIDQSRKTLSGEVLQGPDHEGRDGFPVSPAFRRKAPVGMTTQEPAALEALSLSQIDPDTEEDQEADEEDVGRLSRRMNEAAQFREAVGEEMNLRDQDNLRIIEEDQDDDDDEEDDDNAPEVHIEPVSQKMQNDDETVQGDKGDDTEREQKSESLVEDTSGVPVAQPASRAKARPRWPFATKRFLDPKTNGHGGAVPYEYKGIVANPPAIVERGTNRGNYATLHRKAWLEVSDKYHRYGKHLRIYYRHWESLGGPTDMFFDWLDSKGEAAGQPLPNLEECPRAQLDSDTVLYITNPVVTDGYEVKFVPDDRGRARVIDVDGDPVSTGQDGWIFVLRDNRLYAAQKITSVTGHSKQRFHHSSFFGGKAVQAAGIFLTDENGMLSRLYPHSGHYRPGEAHMQRLLYFLYLEGVDLRTYHVDMQQILHVTREKEAKKEKDGCGKAEKRKKTESLHLMPAVLVACFLAHKARFIETLFGPIRQIRKAQVTTVTEALEAIAEYQTNRSHQGQTTPSRLERVTTS